MTAAERVADVLERHHHALTFDQAIVIAASEAAGKPLDPRQPYDAAVILHAENLLEQGFRVDEAIARARTEAATARARSVRPVDGLTVVPPTSAQPGPLPRPPQRSKSYAHAAPPTDWPAGELIGTCARCPRGVGDHDPTIGVWDGTRWRYTGYTLQRSRELSAVGPYLCCRCAVDAKFGLIDPPVLGHPPGSDSDIHRDKFSDAAEPHQGEIQLKDRLVDEGMA